MIKLNLKLTKKKAYALVALIIMISVFIALPFGFVDIETFWVVTGLVFIFTFFMFPKMKDD